MDKEMGLLERFIVAAIFMFLMLCLMFGQADAKTTNHQNSVGVTLFDDNPYAYMFGSVSDGIVFKCDDDVCTNVTFRPYHTDLLHTEQVLFCGNENESFKGKTGTSVVVTYRKTAQRFYSGVSCHDLIKVFVVPAVGLPADFMGVQ